jgi:peptidoglycan/xylan/chitin deacetylase (PgdA/CDA1 family)
MDIETHTMTHPNLNDLSKADLDYEIRQSKQCLEDHGINYIFTVRAGVAHCRIGMAKNRRNG